MLYSVRIHDNPLRAPIMRIHNNPRRAPIMLYTRVYMLYMTIIPHPEIQPVQKISFTDAGKKYFDISFTINPQTLPLHFTTLHSFI